MITKIQSTNFYDRFKHFCLEHHLLDNISRVHVAFSAGADSTALLACFAALQQQSNIQLCAHHIRHGLRSSDAIDARIAKTTAEQLQIPFIQTDLNLGDLTNNIEDTARKARLDALQNAIPHELRPFTALATAHHGDENLETLLWRLARGCGLEGTTLAPKRTQNAFTRIRPLLFASKQNIYDFLRQIDLPWAEDPTNATDHYQRNRLRHAVLTPYMAQINTPQNVYDSLTRIHQDANALDAFAESFVTQRLHFGTWFCTHDDFHALTRPAQVQILRHAARHCQSAYIPAASLVTQALNLLNAPHDGQKHVTDQTIAYSWSKLGVFTTSLKQPAQPLPDDIPLTPFAPPTDIWGLSTVSSIHATCTNTPKNTVSQLAFATTNDAGPLVITPASRIPNLQTADGRFVKTTELLKKLGLPAPLWPYWPIVSSPSGPLWILHGPRTHHARPPLPGENMTLLFAQNHFF